MADLDGLIGSKISLISQQDIRYEGVLISINAAESSIVLKDVAFLGTEDRVTDPERIVKPTNVPIKYVSFPGDDIKDLFVHEEKEQSEPSAAPAPAPARAPAPAPAPAPKSKPKHEEKSHEERKQAVQQSQPQQKQTKAHGVAGTGNHIASLKMKGATGTGPDSDDIKKSVFDFDAGLSSFNKAAELQKVQIDKANSIGDDAPSYVKDDFFDSLSCDVLDRQAGRDTHTSRAQQDSLNMDTFGATGLQGSQRKYGGRGRGRGGRGGRGRGRGSRGSTN